VHLLGTRFFLVTFGVCKEMTTSSAVVELWNGTNNNTTYIIN
jgi:hypothetical protein